MNTCQNCEMYEAMKEGVQIRIADLEAENAKLREDSKRLDWIIEHCWHYNAHLEGKVMMQVLMDNNADVRKAIDAEILTINGKATA